jgi:hypothetical protein
MQQGYTCYSDYMFCDCDISNSNSFPDIELTIENTIYVIPSKSYISSYGAAWNQRCQLEIMTGDRFILGLNFFHNYYTVFDQENRRVGFAQSQWGSHPP